VDELAVHSFRGHDGVALAYREIGDGRPLVLIHGYVSNAVVNWIKYGHATALADRGHRVVLPDLRGHGDSAHPHQAAAWPRDVLAADGFALLEHLGLDPAGAGYDLAGYSLGGRTVVRMLVGGARPRRAVVCGMALAGILDATSRSEKFRQVWTGLGTHAPRSPAWLAEAFARTTGAAPEAMLALLHSISDTTPSELAAIEVETLIVLGAEDDDNGSGPDLAAALPVGSFRQVPGNHMSAVTKPELATAIGDFLAN
jgi:pimeloyl-ACP methyl ester carboxylesterase